jgi:aminoglycoside phosphotransferase (APT) family kinase protein
VAEDEVLARALRAVDKATGRGNAVKPDPIVLYRSRRICLLLPEMATVARIAPADAESFAASARELAVSRYLSVKGAPVVGPSDAMPSTPFVEEGMTVTLWPHIDHVPADYDDHKEVARAAHALRRVHDALADYPGELPSYAERIEECAALLRRPDALPDVASEDRTFLMRTYERLSSALAAFDIRYVPIHGDAHMGNVFITPSGPLWTDFETACLGPREWDASGVPHLPAFQPLDSRLYAVISEMRSVCVVVWCSALSADPEKRAAAEYQLARLRAGRGAPTAPD